MLISYLLFSVKIGRGVSAISFPAHGSHIYTVGADGMVCEIEAMSGNLLNKFSAASRAISSLAISPGTSHILFFRKVSIFVSWFISVNIND